MIDFLLMHRKKCTHAKHLPAVLPTAVHIITIHCVSNHLEQVPSTLTQMSCCHDHLDCNALLELHVTATVGQSYKLYSHYNSSDIRPCFFTEKVVNI